MTLDIAPDVFGNALAVSESAKQFSEGNPRYIAGMNGCELARLILDDAGIAYPERADEMYLDKSPEYWAGWALAYYQWFTSRSFMEILHAMSLNDIIRMYPLYHEMDLSHFVEQMDRFMKETYPQTRLRDRRSNCGLSQSELASEADVPLRQIQLFEQGQRDINKTSAITLYKLSKALHCKMEDLLEPDLM
jgi:DNA-binding XRE family transcriptional regulator